MHRCCSRDFADIYYFKFIVQNSHGAEDVGLRGVPVCYFQAFAPSAYFTERIGLRVA